MNQLDFWRADIDSRNLKIMFTNFWLDYVPQTKIS